MAALFVVSSATAQDPDSLRLRTITSDVTNPVYLRSPPGDLDRLFILELRGSIKIYKHSTGELDPIPFLNLANDGIYQAYSIAFDPDFETNGFVFLCGVDDDSDDVVVWRYTVSSENPDTIDTGTRTQVITTIPDGRDHHNGGWLGFAADGMLHISVGDNGTSQGHDAGSHCQDPSSLFGKILRIDVRGDDFPEDEARNYAIPIDNPFAGGGGRPEVHCIGLRNPWRASFDRNLQALWIADVGQNNREEVNWIAAGDVSVKNFGWPLREGSIATPTGGVGGEKPGGNVDPIIDYGPLPSGMSVTGGYVYRGDLIPWLQGTYIYADFTSNKVFSLQHSDGQVVGEQELSAFLQPELGELDGLVSFGEDAAGELYILSFYSNRVSQITRPYQIWLDEQFSPAELADEALSGASGDPDSDSWATIFEYVAGTDPREESGPSAGAAVEYSISPGGYGSVRVSRSSSASDVTLRLESSSNLSTWSSESTVVLQDTPLIFEARDTVASSAGHRRFLRIVAILE